MDCSGYQLEGGEPGKAVGQCFSSMSAHQVITYVDTAGTSTTSVNISTSINGIPFIGWNVKEATTTANSSSGAGSGSGSGSGSTTGSQGSSSHGLSTGAKAGIGVSAAIGGIGLIAFFFALLLFARRRRSDNRGAYAAAAYPQQAASNPIYELNAPAKGPAEMSHHQ